MPTAPSDAARHQRGATLLEVVIFLAVLAPLMIALVRTVTVFGAATTQSHHRTTVASENERILQRIASEVIGTSTRIDHFVPATHPRPHPDADADGGVNAHYNLDGGIAPLLDTEYATLDRDGFEFWHPPVGFRRFYIYRTYANFDTIEYQKVRTPLDDMSHVNQVSQTVVQPWSARRKILLEDGRVLLRVLLPGGALRTTVLGQNVADLRFHLNPDGSIIIRLTTRAGTPDGAPAGSSRGASLTSQITVSPRNRLS